MVTHLEVVRANSKDELYQKLFEQYGKQYYHIIDQKTKRKFPIFWKKEYELKVMVLQQKELSNTVDIKPAVLEPQVREPQNEGIRNVLKNLEMKTSELQRKNRTAPFDPAAAAARKKELLKLLKTGFSMYDEAEQPVENKVEQLAENKLEQIAEQSNQKLHSKDMEELKTAISMVAEQTGDEEEKRPVADVIEQFSHILKENDVDNKLIEVYRNALQEELTDEETLNEQEARTILLHEMAKKFKTAPLLDADENQVIVLFGPTGVGKTTTLSKLGWQLYKKKRSFGFITTDVFRAGAIQQLEGYAELMKSELRVAAGREELLQAVEYFRNVKCVDHILVDTEGRNYMDEDAVEDIQEYMEILQPDIACLTFSASMRKKDVLTVLTRFEQVKANCLIVTKLDETESIGDWLSISDASDVPILFVTNGQNITKHIHVPTKEWLAERVLSKDTPLQGEIFDLRTDK